MTEPVLLKSIDDRGVARLTMNRPEIRNAFNTALINEICDTMAEFSANPTVRAIVLTGTGQAFCAGADLNMMKRAANYSPTENKDDARRLAHMLQSIYNSGKPTIAQVNGAAMGGGLGLIAACDIAIGVEEAFFAFSEVRLGLIPAVISPFVVQAMGVRQARKLFVTGERFDAETAVKFGLLHSKTHASAINDAVEAAIDDLLLCAPEAVASAKDLIRSVKFKPISDPVLTDTADRIARRRASPEGKEGIAAFLEKRKPSWIKE